MATDRCEVHGIQFDLDRLTECPICECASDVERYGLTGAPNSTPTRATGHRERIPSDAVGTGAPIFQVGTLPGSGETGTESCPTWRGLGGHQGGIPHRR